ncbi:MAG TPA: sensor histidine kinase [Flavitalea sp.]|nr:sensor histidine kinase [Flavitalea sp.]
MKLFDDTWTSSKKYFSYFCLATIYSLSFPKISGAQTDSVRQVNDSTLIDVAKIRLQQTFYKEIFYTLSARDQVKDEDIPSLEFKRLPFSKNKVAVPPSFVEKDIYLKFTVFNSADTLQSVYFMPARFCKDVRMFSASPGNIRQTFKQVPDSILYTKEYAGYKTLRIPPKDTIVFYTRFNFLRTNVNAFSPRFTENGYGVQSVRELKSRDPMLDMVTYLATGILLFMIIYSLAAYLQYLNIEFIYYSVYAFCSAMLLFSKSYLSMDHTALNFFYEEYLDFIILCTGAYFYLIFVRNFLNTKVAYPRLDKFLRISRMMLVVLLIIFSTIYFFTNKYVTLLILENYVIKVFLCLIGIVFIVYSLRRKNTLLKYLAAGNTCLILCSIFSLCLIVFDWTIVPDRQSLWNRPLYYYELGIVLELIFFLAGLAYKNRRDIIEQVKERERFKLENERKEFEKQMAVMAAQQDERNRISADMHDELGSGVTAIRLMSEIVKSKMKQTSLPEIEKISNSANDLLGKMNTIIWTMKSSNDTLESLIAYIRAHAIEFFDSTPIDCSVHVADVPDVEMTGEKRRNIFLSVKEALNNIMKHSQASKVRIDIMAPDYNLIIKIADNGVGIDTEKLRRFGNGLSNMKRRMQSIHGDFRIESDGGTILYFELPV